MSVRTMARVWELSSHAGSELLMLLAIGDFADDDGEAYPSITTLAEKCRTSTRYAIKLLDALVASGELQIIKHGGVMGRGGKTNRYRILLAQLGLKPRKEVHPSSVVHRSSVVNSGSGSSEPGDNEVVHQSSPKPPENHQEPSVKASPKSGRSKKELQLFKDWLANHPRTDGKVLPPDHPIKTYAKTLGLSQDFLDLHWAWFSAKQAELGNRQKDWLATLRNSVKGNWGRLWFRTNEGTWQLTTVGKQVALEHGFNENMSSSARKDDWTAHAI